MPGGRALTRKHAQLFSFQLLCALRCLASARIVHCDVSLRNCFVNGNCDLRLGDFGAARTDFPSFRWRRSYSFPASGAPCSPHDAPELLLRWKKASSSSDVWAAGLCLSELLLHRPLFAQRGGSSAKDVLGACVAVASV